MTISGNVKGRGKNLLKLREVVYLRPFTNIKALRKLTRKPKLLKLLNNCNDTQEKKSYQMPVVMIKGFPAHFPQSGNDRPAAEHLLGPGVLLDARHATE